MIVRHPGRGQVIGVDDAIASNDTSRRPLLSSASPPTVSPPGSFVSFFSSPRLTFSRRATPRIATPGGCAAPGGWDRAAIVLGEWLHQGHELLDQPMKALCPVRSRGDTHCPASPPVSFVASGSLPNLYWVVDQRREQHRPARRQRAAAHQRCKVLGCPCRIVFAVAEATLMAFSGRAIFDQLLAGADRRGVCVNRHRLPLEKSSKNDHVSCRGAEQRRDGDWAMRFRRPDTGDFRRISERDERRDRCLPPVACACPRRSYTSSTTNVRPSAAAARCRVSSCTCVFEGSSNRSSCDRLVSIRLANALLLSPCSRRYRSICQARTSLTAAFRTWS